MAESLERIDIIFFTVIFILGIIMIVHGFVCLYRQRNRKLSAIFTIPMRRIYFWFSCVCALIIIISFLFSSGVVNFIIFIDVLILCIASALYCLSFDILVLDNGIYSVPKFTPWENITGVSDDFMALYIYRTKGLLKKLGYVKFIWKIQKDDVEKLKDILAEKLKTAEPSG